ncbi:MAG TPA: TIGR01777 family oxidoreductase [Acidimicrobiales bacterium]|nr:TIGR01777 family oxidoreductase [Acidimicrobiales bacterium]
MRIVVTGGSGLIGQALVSRITADGHDVCVLVRRPPGPGQARWDPSEGRIEAEALDGADAVVHLAGAGIGDKRWSPARKDVILRSRVDSTTLLSHTLASLARPPSVLVSASAIGYYGDRGDEELTEGSGPGTGFQADVCRAWEGATSEAESAGIRVVHLRSAVVLSRQGGALAKQLPLFRAGLGGRLGSGDQWLSWISLRDEVGAILHAIDEPSLGGPLNASAPSPVTNREFTSQLGRVLHRPAVLTAPPFALRLALGRQLADELLLGSLRVVPARLTATGYRFQDPALAGALGEAVGR